MSKARVDAIYETCQAPVGRLFEVNSLIIAAAIRAMGKVLRDLPEVGREPVADSAAQAIRRLRANLLSEFRAPSMLVMESSHEIERIRIAYLMLGLQEEPLSILVQSLHSLSVLDSSPLTAALLEAFPEPIDGGMPLFVFGRTKRVAAARSARLNEVIELHEREDLIPMSFNEVRSDLACYERAVFLASPRAFGDSCVTCPVADESSFFFYDFIDVDYERDGWEHPFLQKLQALGADHPESPYRMNFQRFKSGKAPDETADQPVSPETQPALGASIELTEDDLYPRIRSSFTLSNLPLGEEGPAEVRTCRILSLENGFWCAISGRTRLARIVSGSWKIKAVDPDEVELGNLILLLVREPEEVAQMAETNLKEYRYGLELWKGVQSKISTAAANQGWAAVHREFVDLGIANPYPYWSEQNRLGPRNQTEFEKVCLWAGLSASESITAHTACRAWAGLRIRFGHSIADMFVKLAERVLNGPLDNTEIQLVAPPEATFGLYGLFEVVAELGEEQFPSYLSDRVLTPEGRPWQG